MGFAIPINHTKSVYQELKEYNKVKRPYIGISGVDIDENMSKYYRLPVGIYVKSVEDFSAGQKAGIQVGDVILEIDGQKVTTMDEVNKIKNEHNIGDKLKLKLQRDGNDKEITLTLQEQP